ncbi:MAG: uroporphyrinogen-III synthase [Alphaproteobacteria bacterium]
MNRVWITRSQPGADNSARLLVEAGHEVITAPLIQISPPPVKPPTLPDEAFLIVTSKNGLAALTRETPKRHWTVLTVGDATADAARKLGFQTVISAGGNVDDVIREFLSLAPSKDIPVVHICGNNVAGRAVEVLTAHGYSTERHVYYSSQPVAALPEIDLSAMTHVLLYSPLAARTLASLAPCLKHAAAISISPKADRALARLAIGKRLIATAPNEKSMLSLLD